MTAKLNLAEQLFTLGQRHLHLGRDQEALETFERLIRIDELPGTVAEEAQAALADICMRRNKPIQARRHLHVALARQPDSGHYHHQIALTLEEDDIERALHHHRRAVELSPDEAEFHGDLGLCLLAMMENDEGLAHLHKAMELDPDEPHYVRQLMQKLIDADRADDARRTVLAAMFRHGRDQRFRSLWSELCFRTAQQSQHREIMQKQFGSDAPVILRFPTPKKRPSRVETTEDGTTIRIDGPQPVRKPHLRTPAKKRQR